MELKNRRELGNETLEFTDGTTLEVIVYAVPRFQIMKINRLAREITPNKDPAKVKVTMKDEEMIINTLNLAFGQQVNKFDLENNVDSDLEKIHTKYFNKKLSSEKKQESSDSQPLEKDSQ